VSAFGPLIGGKERLFDVVFPYFCVSGGEGVKLKIPVKKWDEIISRERTQLPPAPKIFLGRHL
jgi:hypothetical protein